MKFEVLGPRSRHALPGYDASLAVGQKKQMMAIVIPSWIAIKYVIVTIRSILKTMGYADLLTTESWVCCGLRQQHHASIRFGTAGASLTTPLVLDSSPS